MKKIIVLGAGLVGNAIAIDLKKSNFDVCSVDINTTSLEILNNIYKIKTIVQDLSDKEKLKQLIDNYDLVVSAVPGFMGFETLKTIIEAGKNVVDIAFFPEDPFLLNNLAIEKNVTAVVDCGVAPGMGNIILGYYNTQMQINKYECLVGGLPKIRDWPFEYKAVFSPIDVIEEYIRQARYVENGHIIIREALSDPELRNFKGIGTLEAWNSDGLRSLMTTMKTPNMIEKTLRYPGTIEYLKVLRDTGFFSYEPIEVAGHKIRPIDLTAKLLFPKWQLKPGEEDFTVMQIIIEGTKQNENKKIICYLHDQYNRETNTISMARTTGYTATAAANLIISGNYKRRGISPPEFLGENENNFKYIIDYLANRKVVYQFSEE